MSRGWYPPDVPRDRQVELAYPGIVTPFSGYKPGWVISLVKLRINYREVNWVFTDNHSVEKYRVLKKGDMGSITI